MATHKASGKNGIAKAVATIDVPASGASVEARPARRPSKIATVSHTLDAETAERVRNFAFQQRISESAVIEYSLRAFFDSGDDLALGNRLRAAGAALRRKS